jgi:hypothetical protein
MPPSIIVPSAGMCKIAGGASMQHPVTKLNWWTPAGFFRKKDLPVKYARVWQHTWNDDGTTRKVHDEPVGIIIIPSVPPMWVKVGWKWLAWGESHAKKDFIILDFITKAEYETDLAFGLFKKLRVTNRPVRSFIKRNRVWLRISNRIAIPISSLGCYQTLANSEGPGDFWFIAGVLMAAHACFSVMWMILRSCSLSSYRSRFSA